MILDVRGYPGDLSDERKAAPHVLGAKMEPALRVALDSLHRYKRAASCAKSFSGNFNEPLHP